MHRIDLLPVKGYHLTSPIRIVQGHDSVSRLGPSPFPFAILLVGSCRKPDLVEKDMAKSNSDITTPGYDDPGH